MATYIKIASIAVGSGGSSSIDFQSIPSSYNDLAVHLSFRLTTNSVDTYMKFNNSTSAQYNWIYLRYNPAVGIATGKETSQTTDTYAMFSNASTWTASTFGNAFFYIPNYASSNNKPFMLDSITENNAQDAWSQLHAGMWANSSAIDRITFTNPSGDFAQYTTATLYGIKNL